MKGLRVTLIAVALLALPFVAGAAQTRTQTRTRSGTVRAADAASDCKDQQAGTLAQQQAAGHDPYGLDKKCDDPVPQPPPNQPPVANFAFSCSGLDCNFTSTSSDPDGSVASYAWTFGDGGTSAAQNPSHTYAAAGSYPVTLTVTDNAGASSSPASQTATVSAPPPPPDPGVNRAIGKVWEDIDGNGLRDPFSGEMGLAGWTVQLLDANGQVLSSKVTDADGNFAFDGLGIGTFTVCLVPQPGYTQTVPVNQQGCGGLGYVDPFVNNIGTWALNDFGEMANP